MVGPVNGQLRLLSDKLRTLNKSKAGPFDICCCAGPFFHQTNFVAAKSKGDEGESSSSSNTMNLQQKEAIVKDGKELVNGSITFDIPVLFVDVGDGLPEGIHVTNSAVDALKKDNDEINLDDDDIGEVDGTEKKDEDGDDENAIKTPDGLLRIAPNLYQLVGSDARQSHILDSVADIISVPLPLLSPQTKTSNGVDNTASSKKQREHATSLTIGFLGSKIRLASCKAFEVKSKHTSFLGCDVLISGEWGQGMSSKNGALTAEDRIDIATGLGDESTGGEGGSNLEMGSYDVAELVASSRPRYHLAPGATIPVQVGETARLRKRFIASLPYRYPATSSTSSSDASHAGRFLAMGSVLPVAEAKALGKQFKFIHAVGIVPLAYMDANDRETAKELNSVVDSPYTDASYGIDATNNNVSMMGYMNGSNRGGFPGGLSEAQARRLAQEDAASALGGGGPGGAFRWQQRQRKRPRDGEDGGMDEEEAKRQAIEAANPDNCSLFLHGLHRDPNGMTLTTDALMNAFRPFGCAGIRFPRPKMNQQRHHHHHHQSQAQKPSFAFVDFNTHEEALQCLFNLNGEAVVHNIMLTLKWSSSGKSRPMYQQQQEQPQHQRRNRLTESEAADSTTLFLRLPKELDSSSYPAEFETLRLLAQGTMEDELNVGVPLDSPDRITSKDEPALRVTVRTLTPDTNYGFLEFCSHAAALTTLVVLTGHEDGGPVSDEKLAVSCLITDDMKKKDISHLQGVTLYWAKGGPQQKSGDGGGNTLGLKFNKRHFPPDSRTDCWFCLASPTCEKHLIVAVFDECYVAMPKGGVNDYHALIVPVEHGGDGALVNRKLAPEMESVKAKLRVHARTLKRDLFVFERCIQTKGGYHTHVQCIPVDADSGPKIQTTMLDMASKAGFQLKEITSDLNLNALEDDWSGGYFYAEIPLPGGGDEFRRFIYRAGGESGEGGGRGTVPLQFGREVLAEVMENPDIAQWKACVVSQEKEEELTAKFRKTLSNISAS